MFKRKSIYFSIINRPNFALDLSKNSRECLTSDFTKCFNVNTRIVPRRLYQIQPKQTTNATSTIISSIKANEERVSSFSLKESVKNFNERLKRGEVVIYKSPQEANKFFWWWHIAAFLQFIFWANLADLSWRFQQRRKTEQKSSINISFVDKFKPAIFVGSYLSVGFGIGAIMFLIPARSVLTISILKNGKMAKIITGRKYQWGREKKIPVKNLYISQPAWNGKGSAIFLRSENERLAYMLERSGNFEDPKIFDLLFYKNKSNKKGK
ncbi:8029_t:CDS:2 [Funneliformis geosporum]|uniref:1660_t:CDS:1 n=1 Tax=Funneliformis geosporum TaxID=1117311 RepID=A0A9W4SV79_9GLOM|nr:8029_t:CDS:2 [Funneliformis geosporum]CAI2181795.1 1660_t:CDS:2 [Funneliformis geosporum]